MCFAIGFHLCGTKRGKTRTQTSSILHSGIVLTTFEITSPWNGCLYPRQILVPVNLPSFKQCKSSLIKRMTTVNDPDDFVDGLRP